MSDLPKIAFTRLKAGSHEAKASGTTPGLNSVQGAEHLDANLLSAFAEKSLSEQEHAQVLDHLSQCADCREIAAFIIPPEAQPAAVPGKVASRKWNPWSLVRWGSLAAALGSITILVATHSGLWKQNREVAVSAPSPASADKSVETLTVNAPSPSSLPAKPNENYAQAQAGASARQEDALKKSRGSVEALDQRQAQLQAGAQSTRMTASQPPMVLRAENTPTRGIERHESLGDNAVSRSSAPPAVVVPLPAAPPPAGKSAAAPRATDKVRAEPQSVPSVSESAEVRADTSPVQQETTRGSAGSVRTMASAQSKPGAAQAASSANERVNAKEESHGSMFGVMESRKNLKLKTSAIAIAWSVSPDGKVRRSSDGAKTYHQIEIAQGIKFQAVAANGNEVWAGGENGALFHSLDDGANWAPVTIASGESALRDSITAIQFSDTHHLTVVTTSGAQWISEDDGQHWKAYP